MSKSQLKKAIEVDVECLLWAEVCKAVIDLTTLDTKTVHCKPIQKIIYASCIHIVKNKIKVYRHDRIFPTTVISRKKIFSINDAFEHMNDTIINDKHEIIKNMALKYVSTIFDKDYIHYKDDNFF